VTTPLDAGRHRRVVHAMRDIPRFESLFFDSLEPDELRRIEHMPRWAGTMPVSGIGSASAFVSFSVFPNDDVDAVYAELRDWLRAKALPPGRRVTFAD
jgi:hypothetical protein